MPKQLAIAVIGVLLFAIGFPARAEASPEYARTVLSSLAAIQTYLVSIGVDPASVVVQQGRLNYAGPDCPGADWNCTTATKVVQISQGSSPAANIFDCLPALDAQILGLNDCLIVQSTAQSLTDPGNSATCSFDASDGAKQKCKIKQSSKKGNNSAEVRARSTQSGGSSQTASQDAEIDQTSDTGSNTAKITQTMQQTLKTDPSSSVSQEQQARQNATVNQTASSTGSNSSSVAQSISQDESASSGAEITQRQNTASTEKNQELNVTQTTGTGNNTSSVSQRLSQSQQAQSVPGPVTQTQGTAIFGGQKAMVLQTTTAPGVNSSTSSLDEPQTQVANTQGTYTPTQLGPQDCCATQHGGTAANFNSVVESNVQNQTTGFSQSSEQNGHCSEDVTVVGAVCSVDQTYTANGNTSHFSDTQPMITHDRFCNGGVEGGCFVD